MSLEISERKHVPYIGFPILPFCSFRCSYCTPGGEASPSTIKVANKNLVLEVAKIAYQLGSRKFRVTGGEPFFHKDLGEILFGLAKLPGSEITVNTTGFPLIDRQGILTKTPKNVSFIVGLDTLDKKNFEEVRSPRIPNLYERVLDNTRFLSERKILKRLNMVVTNKNVGEVFRMMTFCKDLGCDLKIADVAENINQHRNIYDIYTSIERVEQNLERIATNIEKHRYSQSFGIPCNIYEVEGVRVTVKNSRNGARYNLQQCSKCEHFLCQEGLYFISALQDGGFSACRLNKIHSDGKDRLKDLQTMIEIVSNSEFIARDL